MPRVGHKSGSGFSGAISNNAMVNRTDPPPYPSSDPAPKPTPSMTPSAAPEKELHEAPSLAPQSWPPQVESASGERIGPASHGLVLKYLGQGVYCEVAESAKKTGGKIERLAGTIVGSNSLKDKGLMKEHEVERRKQAWKDGQAIQKEGGNED